MSEAIVERKPLPTGTVTFLFSDIEGSTERWERFREAMRGAVRRHDEIMHQTIAAHDGFVFKTVGDAFCAAFNTVPNAIAAAVDAQRAMAQEDFREVDGLRARMAIHIGLAEERNGDYFGPTVNRVARLLSIGHGGQVLVSGSASDLAQGELPPKTTFRDLGAQRLKDLAQPEQVYQLIAPDLTADFPPLRSLDALPNNLPLQVTSFIGREEELARVKERLQQTRLLTLVGAGGIGKTRLALQVGAELLDQYEDGVWLVEFAALSDPDVVPGIVAGVLGVPEVQNRSLIDSIVYVLKPKRALLIFDNCEHLVEPTAKVVDAVLHGCPSVRLLVSSRQGLGIDGETVHRVASLALPESDDGLTAEAAMRFGAIALFAERATAAVETFQLTDANAPVIAHICRRLDGIALAIELAAPRLKALTAAQLSERLAERFRILTGGKRTALQRQQTMRALIDWSYDLLTEAEKGLLRRVAIFAGGWTLEAAGDVCSDENIESWDVLDLLTSLVDKSLVVAELQGTSPRYRLLESTREYALEKLKASGEGQTMARKQAEYFARAAQKADTDFNTMPLQIWLPPLELETENFRAALDWALTEKHDKALGATIAGALERFWSEGGLDAEGRQWAHAALAAADETVSKQIVARIWLALSTLTEYQGEAPLQAAQNACALYAEVGDERGLALARLSVSISLFRFGRVDDMEEPVKQALATFRALGEVWWTARCLDRQALVLLLRGEFDASRRVFADALAFYQARGDDAGCDRALANLAELEFSCGNVERAIKLANEALAIDLRLKRKSNLAVTCINLAAYNTSLGDYEEARTNARRGLRTAREAQIGPMITVAVQHLALIGAIRGDQERAAQLAGYTDANYRATGTAREPTEQQSFDRLLGILREHLPPEELTRRLEEGAAMSEDHAIDEALHV